MPSTAALVSTALLAFVVIFQVAMACGAPWGGIAMGGRYPGKFPLPMRVAAAVQAIVMILLGCIVLVNDGFLLPAFYSHSTIAIWGVVAIFSLSFIMNLATPSKWERIIWAPVAALVLVCTVLVAIS